MALPGRKSYGRFVSHRTHRRGAPQAATRGLGTAGIWASVVSPCGYLFTMGFRRIGQDHGACDRGSPDLCETTATPIIRTNPGCSRAAHRAPGLLQISRETYGVNVFDSYSGQTASLNADRRFVAASLSKLYAMLTLYKMASQDELSLDDEITMHSWVVWAYGIEVASNHSFSSCPVSPANEDKTRADERTRTADLTSSQLVAACSRRWLESEIRLPKLFALASINPGGLAPPQSHRKTFVRLFRTRLLRPSSEPRW
jgi:Beta-lactamase enzyme family